MSKKKNENLPEEEVVQETPAQEAAEAVTEAPAADEVKAESTAI